MRKPRVLCLIVAAARAVAAGAVAPAPTSEAPWRTLPLKVDAAGGR